MLSYTPLLALLALCTLIGCDDEESTTATQDHQITAYGEDFIEVEIPADESDGWRIEFERFVVLIHAVQAGGVQLDGPYAVDLTADSGGTGHALGTLPGGPYDRLDYRIAPAASAEAINVSADALQPMFDGGYAIWIEGSATKDGVTKTFAWGFDTDTTYRACETMPAEAGDAVRSALTIHGDHFFFDDLAGGEPNVAFELIASADADDDGVVTPEELAAVDITAETRYQVGNRTGVEDLWAYLKAQSTLIGHIDGEGHCD